MKNTNSSLRKASVLLAAGVGAAVGLSSPPAHAVNGADGNDIAFNANATEFGGKVNFRYMSYMGMKVIARNGTHNTSFAATAGFKLNTYNISAVCSAGSFLAGGKVTSAPGGPTKYIKVRFTETAIVKYGWLQYQKVGAVLQFGAWSYNNAGGAIKTLGESVTAHTLPLANGKNKIVWTNANEEGVARYEVQTQDASGAWNAVRSDAAGAGSYSATVPAGATCRILLEKVDGETEEIGF